MISIKNLNVAYGQSEILHDISFETDQGQIVAVMGKNGMGKTTLMKSLIGLLKPTSGSIALDGVDVMNLDSYPGAKPFFSLEECFLFFFLSSLLIIRFLRLKYLLVANC